MAHFDALALVVAAVLVALVALAALVALLLPSSTRRRHRAQTDTEES